MNAGNLAKAAAMAPGGEGQPRHDCAKRSEGRQEQPVVGHVCALNDPLDTKKAQADGAGLRLMQALG